jgi:hypothetical protein
LCPSSEKKLSAPRSSAPKTRLSAFNNTTRNQPEGRSGDGCDTRPSCRLMVSLWSEPQCPRSKHTYPEKPSGITRPPDKPSGETVCGSVELVARGPTAGSLVRTILTGPPYRRGRLARGGKKNISAAQRVAGGRKIEGGMNDRGKEKVVREKQLADESSRTFLSSGMRRAGESGPGRFTHQARRSKRGWHA